MAMEPQMAELCQVLSQTLAPVPEQIRAAEQRLTALRAEQPHLSIWLLQIAAGQPAGAPGVQQAAAITLKNLLFSEWRVQCQCRVWRDRIMTVDDFGVARDWTRGQVVRNDRDRDEIEETWDSLPTVVGWIPAVALCSAPGSNGSQGYGGASGGEQLNLVTESSQLTDEVRAHFKQHLIPTMLFVESKLVRRDLVMCLQPLINDRDGCGPILQTILANLHERCRAGKAQEPAIIALIRCLKIAIRVAWRWADLLTGRDDGTVDGLRRGIELLHQLLGVSLEHEMVPLHKVVSQALLLCAQDNRHGVACDMVLDFWRAQGDGVAGLVDVLLGTVREVPAVGCPDAVVVMKWKAKCRVLKFFRLMAQQSFHQAERHRIEHYEQQLPDGVSLQDAFTAGTLHDPPPDPFNAMLRTTFVSVLEAAVALFAHRPSAVAGLVAGSDGASELAEAAFESFVAAALRLMTTPEFVDRGVREAYFAPQGEELLTKVLFQFLCVDQTDINLIEDDPEEYSNRSNNEFALTTSDLEDDEIYDYVSDSTSRGAAMLAVRDLVTMGRSVLLVPYLEFLRTTLASLDYSTTESISVCCGAIRAIVPTITDLAPGAAPAADAIVLDLVQRLLIPAADVGDDVALGAHLRSVACGVLGRLWLFLTVRHQHPVLLAALQLIMNKLYDSVAAVRKHALEALLQSTRSASYGDDETEYGLEYGSEARNDPLAAMMTQLAPTCLKWLAQLLDLGGVGTHEVLMALCSFLNQFSRRLGDLDPTTDPNYGNPELRCQRILQSHGELLAKLTSKFFETIQLLQRQDEHYGTYERTLASYVECIHACALSTPRDLIRLADKDGNPVVVETFNIHSACLEQLVPFCAAMLTPEVLHAAAKFYVHIDAFDTFELLPHDNAHVVVALLPRTLDLLKREPHNAEMLVCTVCQFVHFTGTMYMLQPAEQKLFFEAVSACFASEAPYTQCNIADLVRSLALASSCLDGETMMRSGHRGHAMPSVLDRVGTTLNPLAVEFRVPYITLLVHYLAQAIVVQPTNTCTEQLPVRLVAALCSMLYVDAANSWETIRAATFEGGTGEQLFYSFFATGCPHFSHRRDVDVRICLLGLAATVQHEWSIAMAGADPTRGYPWPLLQVGFVMFGKLAQWELESEDGYDDDAAVFASDPEDHVRDIEQCPDLLFCIADNATEAWLRIVQTTIGDDPGKIAHLVGLIGPELWDKFHSYIAADGDAQFD